MAFASKRRPQKFIEAARTSRCSVGSLHLIGRTGAARVARSSFFGFDQPEHGVTSPNQGATQQEILNDQTHGAKIW